MDSLVQDSGYSHNPEIPCEEDCLVKPIRLFKDSEDWRFLITHLASPTPPFPLCIPTAMANIIQNSSENNTGRHLRELLRKNSDKAAHVFSFATGAEPRSAPINSNNQNENESTNIAKLAESSENRKKKEKLTATSRKGKNKKQDGPRFQNQLLQITIQSMVGPNLEIVADKKSVCTNSEAESRQTNGVTPSDNANPTLDSTQMLLKLPSPEESDSQSSTEDEESDSDATLESESLNNSHDFYTGRSSDHLGLNRQAFGNPQAGSPFLHDGPFDENCPFCQRKAWRKLMARNLGRR
ncbi:hypothetical protein O181_062352 [Austropuccinia psidii MF-1]|uniref:Uncharacterized protein n=1 Tax=Austropuccinia psidii MF-1 TaxID=1389203 RepID=A0A9Q3EMH3_9BASI|nr:hypothetical protein [Austropuccinia psidii MF-1]